MYQIRRVFRVACRITQEVIGLIGVDGIKIPFLHSPRIIFTEVAHRAG